MCDLGFIDGIYTFQSYIHAIPCNQKESDFTIFDDNFSCASFAFSVIIYSFSVYKAALSYARVCFCHCARRTSSFNLILDKNVLTVLPLNAINVVTYSI